MLYTQNIIDKTIYNKIDNVRKKLRNKLQHEHRSFRYSSDQAEEAEQLMINALDCVKFLKTKYDSINK